MYKLLLLDIDGTLRDECRGIAKRTKKAIELIHQAKVFVAVCTGRSMGVIPDDVLGLPIDGYIAGGGSFVRINNHVLFDVSFPSKVIQECIHFLSNMNIAFTLESQTKVFMNKRAYQILSDMNHKKAQVILSSQKQFLQEKIIYKDNLDEYAKEPIHKLCIWTKKDCMKRLKTILDNDMEFAQYDEQIGYYEIIRAKYHKGNAVTTMQSYLHIHKEDTICFGDGLNDISMFQACGYCVAMGNAHPILKQKADAVCEEVWEDGIYKELLRLSMIDDEEKIYEKEMVAKRSCLSDLS